jgi:hypothetical protein
MEAGLPGDPDQPGQAAAVAFTEHEDVPALCQTFQQAKSRPFQVPPERGELKDPVYPGQPIEA